MRISKISKSTIFNVLAMAALAAVTFCSTASSQSEKESMNLKGDPQILGVISAINENEVRAAEEALKKETRPEVLSYADTMKKEHSQNLEKTLDLSERIAVSPEHNAQIAQKQRLKGAKELTKLVPENGEEFAKTYIDSMVKDHTEAIRMIDEEMLTAAENEELKQHLTETRGHIARHLDEAKEIQSNLES